MIALGIALEAIGFVVVCAWLRPAIDLTHIALSFTRTALTSLYAKGPTQ